MKIIIISYCLKGGGAEKFCRLAHEQFRKDKHESTLICIRDDAQAQNHIGTGIIFLNKGNLRGAAFQITRFILKNRPEVIITTLFQINVLISILKLLGFIKNTKFILRHSNDIFERMNIFQFKIARYFYCSMINKAASIIVSQSNYLKEKLILRGIRDANHIVIPNMIEGKILFNRLPDDFCVYVGRLEPIKNLFELSKCFNDKNKFPMLLIIGEGSDRDRLQHFIQKHRLNVEIQGWSDNAVAKIERAKFMLLTSISEGLPNVVLESLQVNTPIISTDNSQLVRDLNDLKYCSIVNGFDYQAITNGIKQFIKLGDFTVFSTLQEQRKLMKQFNAKFICDRLLASVS